MDLVLPSRIQLENAMLEKLSADRHSEAVSLIIKILQSRKERYSEALLDRDDPRTAGRGCECRDLLARLLTSSESSVNISENEE